MKRVFAVLFFLVFVLVCMVNNKFSNIISENKEIVLYTSPGNFDDDTQMERICLIKTPEGMLFFRLDDRGHIFESDAIPCALSHWEMVEDINNNGIDDIILCTTDENREDLYVFTFDNSLKTIFSPEIANRYLNSSASKTVFSNLKICENISEETLIYESCCVEINYGISGPYFISEGQILSGNTIISSLSTSISVNAAGTVSMKELTN